jgi:hypothetical protein
MRVAIANMLAATKPPIEKLTAEAAGTVPSEEATVEVASSVRLSLEVVDDRVEMLVTAGNGERRVLSRPEQDLLALVAEKPSLGDLRDNAKRNGHPESFLDELLDAGVLSTV